MQNRLRYVGIAIRFGNLQRPRWAVPVVGAAAFVFGWVVAVAFVPDPEEQLTNALSWLAVASGFLALVGQLPGILTLRSKYPPLVLAAGALCFALSAYCLIREPSGTLLLRLSLPLLLAGLQWYYVFVLSIYRGKYRLSRLQVGDRFPELPAGVALVR
jgi:hypothetical protein